MCVVSLIYIYIYNLLLVSFFPNVSYLSYVSISTWPPWKRAKPWTMHSPQLRTMVEQSSNAESCQNASGGCTREESGSVLSAQKELPRCKRLFIDANMWIYIYLFCYLYLVIYLYVDQAYAFIGRICTFTYRSYAFTAEAHIYRPYNWFTDQLSI